MAEGSNQYVRPMRLGTRSCVECRRRKVRCVVESKDGRCKQCIAHGTICRAQGTKRVTAGDERRETASSQGSYDLWENNNLPLPSPALTYDTSISTSPSATQALADAFVDDNEVAPEASQAPLLEYLRTALQVTRSNNASGSGPSRSGSAIGNFVMPPCPDLAALITIFRCTEPFWTTWPLAAAVEKGSGFPRNVVDAITFTHNSLRSEDHGEVAKCLSWLALCFFQLPVSLAETGPTKLPLPKSKLTTLYLRQASRLISDSIDSGSRSLTIIEALTMQFKCYVDLARPQQAWMCGRRAIDHALILGLDRAQASTADDQYRRDLWNNLWGFDRRMSLFLGLPYAVADHLVIPQADSPSPHAEARVMCRIFEVSGRIIDRNRSVNPPYSTTTRISEEMDALKAEIPESWWDLHRAASDVPMAAVFYRRVIIFSFHHMIQLLHLPYVLEAWRDDRYRYSRNTVISSAELMLVTWAHFPSLNDIPLACDYLDFCAFHAAVILATDLLSAKSSWSTTEEDRLWGLIGSTAEAMQCKADILGCTVPAQSAEVLRRLHAARHGSHLTTEPYEVVIPCFGKISLRPPSMPKSPVQAGLGFANADIPTFDFDVDFDNSSFGFRFPLELDAELELGGSWGYDISADAYSTSV